MRALLTSPDVLGRARAAILANGVGLGQTTAFVAIYGAVLKHFGIKSDVVSVRLSALNPEMRAYLAAHDWTLPNDKEEATRLFDRGARTITVGGPPKAGAKPVEPWPGHVVLMLKAAGGNVATLVDLAAPRVDRPSSAIVVPDPARIDFPAEEAHSFLAGKSEAVGRTGNGAMLIYKTLVGDGSYAPDPAWAERKTRWRQVVRELVMAMDAYAAGARTLTDVLPDSPATRNGRGVS